MVGITLGVTVGFFLATTNIHAQTPNFDTCTADIFSTMASEQRAYRSVLFGLSKAEREPLGAIRHLQDGSVWMKTQPNTWQSLINTTVLTDIMIDAASETDRLTGQSIRRGLFEIRHASTSELIPALTQSIRALQCRLAAICLSVEKARETSTPTVTVDAAGCVSMSFPRFAGCAFTKDSNPALPIDITARCLESADALLSREIGLLEMLVSYDAGYRSLLQFAGAFENFTNTLRFPLVRPLWETASILGQLDRIPCFISQCDQ